MELHPIHRGDGRFVSPNELAGLAGLRPATVYQYIQRGLLPPPEVKMHRVQAWRFETVEPWLAEMAKLHPSSDNRAKAKAAKDAAKVAFGWTEGGAE